MSENYQSKSKVVDIRKTSSKEINYLIPIWSEGNPELEKLLYQFIGDGIQTVGCCSGHDTGDCDDIPYVCFKVGEDANYERILDFLAKLDDKGINLTISFIKSTNTTPICGIYAPNTGRDNGEFFRNIKLAYSSKEISMETRAKYEAFRTVLVDPRYGGYCTLNYSPGDENVSTVLQKAKWLRDNPCETIDYSLGDNEITPIVYPIEWIKRFAEKSKHAL